VDHGWCVYRAVCVCVLCSLERWAYCRTTVAAWTYVVRPKPEIYRMPLPELVEQFREALHGMSRKAEHFERMWARSSKESSTRAQGYKIPQSPSAEKVSSPRNVLPDTTGSSRRGVSTPPLRTVWLSIRVITVLCVDRTTHQR
jgi:hypothetical protein